MDAPLSQLVLPTREARSSAPNKDRLDLSYSFLTLVPSEIARFRHLRTLRLDHNDIVTPEWKLLMSIETLREVDLSQNRIRELPVELASWHCIQLLDVSYNHIESCPSYLWPFFWLPVYARSLMDPLTGQVHEHDPANDLELERKYGRDKIPAVVRWHISNLCGGHPGSIPLRVSEPRWRFAELTDKQPRIKLAGNVELAKSQPYLFSPRREWRKVVKEWREALEPPDNTYYFLREPPRDGEEEADRPSGGERNDALDAQKARDTEEERAHRRKQRLRDKHEGKERQQKHTMP